MHNNRFRNESRIAQLGFTLIELMIVVAIIGIIAAIGYPSYTEYMERTRRIDAMTLLSEISGEQQRFFSENNRFAAELTDMGYPTDAIDSENGFYSASVTDVGPNSYVLSAVPVAGQAQENDTHCATFTINSAGSKGVEGASLTADECWK